MISSCKNWRESPATETNEAAKAAHSPGELSTDAGLDD